MKPTIAVRLDNLVVSLHSSASFGPHSTTSALTAHSPACQPPPAPSSHALYLPASASSSHSCWCLSHLCTRHTHRQTPKSRAVVVEIAHSAPIIGNKLLLTAVCVPAHVAEYCCVPPQITAVCASTYYCCVFLHILLLCVPAHLQMQGQQGHLAISCPHPATPPSTVL